MSNHDSSMNDEERRLRDNINKELERLGFHLRIFTLLSKTNEAVFNFVPPIGEWFKELSYVDSLVVKRIKEWQDLGGISTYSF